MGKKQTMPNEPEEFPLEPKRPEIERPNDPGQPEIPEEAPNNPPVEIPDHPPVEPEIKPDLSPDKLKD